MEELTGEKVEQTAVSAEELQQRLEASRPAFTADSEHWGKQVKMNAVDYLYSMFVRGDTEPKYAKYLGYLDTRELYPNIKTRGSRDYLVDALEGKEGKLYSNFSVESLD